MQFDIILIGVTFAIGIISIGIAVAIVTNLRRAHGFWQLAVMFFLLGIYATAYALELAATSIDVKILFNHIQYIAIPFMAPFWFLLAVKFGWRDRKPKWWQTTLAVFIPSIVMISVQFTYYTPFDWYYTFAEILPGSAATLGIDVLVLGKGWMYYVQAVHNLLVLALVGALYVKIALKSTGIKRRQSWILGTFGFAASMFISVTLFSTVTSGLDYVLYAISAISFIILYFMFRYDLFILTPSAHQATFEKALDPILVLDEHYDVISWNTAFDDFGKDVVHFGMPLSASFLPEEFVESVKGKETVPFEHHDKRYIAETFPLSTKHGTLSGYIIRFNDMTSYLERIEKLDYEASHDSLTAVFNRRAFFAATTAYLDDPTHGQGDYSVMMIDIDDFKKVNDTYGHPVGDVVLEDLARIIQSALDENATLARYGGEEFVVFVRDARPEAARVVAERIRVNVEQASFEIGNLSIRITVSVGVKGARVGSGSLKETIKGADEALYISKRSNKNVVTTVL
ncbi:MAG: diguanylate cyclase [Bacillota bacterium]|nr:diguanylate cyclase [Bacillota bacterium]